MSNPDTLNSVIRRIVAFPEVDFPLAVKEVRQYCPLRFHEHEVYLEIVLIIDGRAVHHLEKGDYGITAGDLLLIPIGVKHTYLDCSDLRYYNVLAGFEDLQLPLADLPQKLAYQELFGSEACCFHLNAVALEECRILVASLRYTLQCRRTGYRFQALHKFMKLLDFICREYENSCSAVSPEAEAAIIQLEKYLEENFCKKYSISELCRRAKVSRSVLFREFHRYFNAAPLERLHDIRMQQACTLLSSEPCPIGEIARRCGFADQSYFSAQFKKKYGMTPAAFRKMSI